MKSDVRNIATEMGVINEIIIAKPTDGLWDDSRTDEDQIGASYDELEWAMNELKKKNNESNYSLRQKEVLAILKKFNNANSHKMKPIPICEIPKSITD